MADQKRESGLSSDQLRGADGTCETVMVGGVRINKHEYDEETHGALDKGQKVSGGKVGSKYDDMTVDELKADLDRRHIEYTSDDLKDDLVKKAKKGK